MVVACASPPAPTETSHRSTVVVAVPSWYAPEDIPSEVRAADRWRSEDPNREIVFKTLFGKRDALLQKTMLGAKRGEFADVVLVRNEWLGRLAAEGLILPLSPEAAQKVRDNAIPALLPAIADGDRVWGIPFDADVLVLWRNTGFKAENGTGAARMLSTALPALRSTAAASSFLAWYFRAGGELIAGGRVHLDASAARNALEAMSERAGDVDDRRALAAMEQADVFSCLASGRCAATVGGSWERGMLQKQSALSGQIEALPFQNVFTAADTPVAMPVTLVGGWSFALLPGAQADAEAFALRLLDPEAQRDKLRENALLPAAREALSDPWFTENPDGPTFRLSLEGGRAAPLHEDMSPALDHIATMVTEVFLNAKTPAQAADDAARAIAETPSPARTVEAPPIGSLRVTRPDGTMEMLTRETSSQHESRRLADVDVIALERLCPGCGKVRARVTAVDGFSREVGVSELPKSFLEPQAQLVLIAQEGGETFTIRDVTEIAFSSSVGNEGLTIAMCDKSREWTSADLTEIAGDGILNFSELLDGFGLPDPAPRTVRLVAADGYRREIPWTAFTAGSLEPKGMKCSFPSLGSKDQVRDLARVEF